MQGSIAVIACTGGAEGFVTGYIGGAAGTALTNALGKTATMAPLLNSTSTVTRVASHAVIGSISQIGAGVTTRFAGSMLTNGLNVEKSAKEAFNLQGILMDGAIGGVFGGLQGLKKPQAFTSSQVQQVKGVGDGGGVANKSGVKSVDPVTQSGAGGVNRGRTPTVIYGSNDISKYQYNMIENPGPLAEIQGNPAKNFYGGRYNVEVLTEDRIYYRGGNSDNALGQWFTKELPESIAKMRIDTSVKPQWIDPITGELTGESIVDTVYAIKIPKGTTVYTGPVGPQGGVYCGGYNMMQTFIKEPWKLDYQVISKSPLN